MATLFLCTDGRDSSDIQELLSGSQSDVAGTNREHTTAAVISSHPAAAAARIMQLVERISTAASRLHPGALAPTVSIIVRVPGLARISRISHAVAVQECWFPDLTCLDGDPLVSVEESPPAWAFAAACSILPPEAVVGFAAGPEQPELLTHAMAATDAIAHTRVRFAERYAPTHVKEASDRASDLAERSGLTVAQRVLVVRAASEAAVRAGSAPSLPEHVEGLKPGKASRSEAVAELISKLERVARAKA